MTPESAVIWHSWLDSANVCAYLLGRNHMLPQ